MHQSSRAGVPSSGSFGNFVLVLLVAVPTLAITWAMVLSGIQILYSGLPDYVLLIFFGTNFLGAVVGAVHYGLHGKLVEALKIVGVMFLIMFVCGGAGLLMEGTFISEISGSNAAEKVNNGNQILRDTLALMAIILQVGISAIRVWRIARPGLAEESLDTETRRAKLRDLGWGVIRGGLGWQYVNPENRQSELGYATLDEAVDACWAEAMRKPPSLEKS